MCALITAVLSGNSNELKEPGQQTMIEARGRLAFISGMTARRIDGTIAGIGDIEAQTRQLCENVKSAVEHAGGTMDDICRVDVYVRNMEHFDQIHKVRRKQCAQRRPLSGVKRTFGSAAAMSANDPKRTSSPPATRY